MTKKGIPDGWLPVRPIGKPVSGTRFLAFKVPLKTAMCNNLRPHQRFSPEMLLEKVPNLGLVIDLTNTQRYYDKHEFLHNGVHYMKISCPGQKAPGRELMMQFFNVVDNFMQSEDTEDKLIGVHCTHGINRTGYFICTYMVHKLGFTPANAISTFQEARGHKIIRDYIIKAIQKENEENSKDSLQKLYTSDTFPEQSSFEKHRQKPDTSESLPQPSSSGKPRPSPRKKYKRKQRGGHSHPPGPRNRGGHSHPSGPHNQGKKRVSHYSFRPSPEKRGPPARDSYGHQSQLNYYEEEDRGHGRFHWKRGNFKNKRYSRNSKS